MDAKKINYTEMITLRQANNNIKRRLYDFITN